jgi:hypothetical protein
MSAARFEIRADNRRFYTLFSLVTHSRTQGLCKSYKKFFSRSIFCLGGIPGLFFRDWRVIGLSRVFLSLRIPLGISVETCVLEIEGLELGLGLIMGDFRPPVPNESLSHVDSYTVFSEGFP